MMSILKYIDYECMCFPSIKIFGVAPKLGGVVADNKQMYCLHHTTILPRDFCIGWLCLCR